MHQPSLILWSVSSQQLNIFFYFKLITKLIYRTTPAIANVSLLLKVKLINKIYITDYILDFINTHSSIITNPWRPYWKERLDLQVLSVFEVIVPAGYKMAGVYCARNCLRWQHVLVFISCHLYENEWTTTSYTYEGFLCFLYLQIYTFHYVILHTTDTKHSTPWRSIILKCCLPTFQFWASISKKSILSLDCSRNVCIFMHHDSIGHIPKIFPNYMWLRAVLTSTWQSQQPN